MVRFSPRFCSGIMCCLFACLAASAHARMLLQSQDFDLILGVNPNPTLDYGGRHITIATVKAPSLAKAAAVVNQCSFSGWTMRGTPGKLDGPACIGHMNPGATSCKDDKDWNIDPRPTPTISIASKTLDAYADCLNTKLTKDVQITPWGPNSTKKLVWHSALYGSSNANAIAEFKAFVNNREKWVPYINHRKDNCAGSKGNPSCWQWTKL